MKPEITFEPFPDDDSEIDEYEDFEDGQTTLVHASLSIRFSSDEDAVKLAEMMLAHFRGADRDEKFRVPGRFWFFHTDKSLPPSAVTQGVFPDWLRLIFDAYRKTETPELLSELRRLQGIVAAVTSAKPDSYFDEEQNEHRADAKAAQDRAFGSREELRELLEAARDALRHYAAGSEPLRARHVLAFIEK